MTTGYVAPNTVLHQAQRRVGTSPIGRWLISKAVCLKAPFFASISPRFTRLEPGHVEAVVKNQRRVRNHIGSVHAIAMCNVAELVGGTCMELSVDARLRWIPVGMRVRYQSIARSDIRAVCELPRYDWSEPQDVIAPVRIYDREGTEVFSAEIDMRLSEKKRARA